MDRTGIKGKAQAFLDQHGDTIEANIAKAEQFAKGRARTTGQSETVGKVGSKLRGLLDDGRGRGRPGAA